MKLNHEQYEKIAKLFSFITSKVVETKILNFDFSVKSGNDSKKCIVSYSNGDKAQCDDVKEVSLAKSQFLINLQNYQNLQIFSTRNLKKFLGNLVEILFCVFLFIYVYLKNGLNCFSFAIVVISP